MPNKISSAIVFLCAYLPFQLALNPAAGIDLASVRVLVIFIFFAWLAKGLKDRKIIVKNNLLTGLVGAFLFFNFLSLFYAENPVWSARKLLFLFSIFPLYFVISGATINREKAEKIIKALAISGAAAGIIGLIQFFSQFIFSAGRIFDFWANYIVPPFLGANLTEAVLKYPSWLVGISGSTYIRATSVFPDPHMFSMYLGMLLPLAIALAVKVKSKRWIFAAVIIFAADILTFSRGGYLGLLGGLAFLLLFLIPNMGRRFKFILAGLFFLVLAAVFIPNPISSRFGSSFNLNEGSNAGRIEMWKTAGKIIAKHPLSGVGIGNFSYAVNPMADYREPIYAHNAYLDILAEAGLVAGLSWIGIIILAIFSNLKRRKNILRVSLAISLFVFSAHSLVETGLYSPTVLTLLIIILGLSNADTNEEIV